MVQSAGSDEHPPTRSIKTVQQPPWHRVAWEACIAGRAACEKLESPGRPRPLWAQSAQKPSTHRIKKQSSVCISPHLLFNRRRMISWPTCNKQSFPVDWRAIDPHTSLWKIMWFSCAPEARERWLLTSITKWSDVQEVFFSKSKFGPQTNGLASNLVRSF